LIILFSVPNKKVKDQRSGLCSRYWGDKLTRRLNKIQTWAEKQGLELAADCHLSRIIQAAFFLHTPKNDIKDLSTISSNCFALNSLQIKCLLKNYLLAPNEPALSPHLCNNLISIAQNTADEVLKQEGRSLQLEEEVGFSLSLLLFYSVCTVSCFYCTSY
jgi:afadin